MSTSSMQYRRLGDAGVKVSALSLGGWTIATDQCDAIVRRAFDAGINFFDLADVYANGETERAMGAALRKLPRHELVISSKVFWPMSDDVNDRGLSRKHIMESIDKTLERIGVDYLDVYFCHRYDADTALSETVRAMSDLVRAGKILYWGTSEWSKGELLDAHAIADRKNLTAPIVEQPQYNLLSRARVDREIGPAARETGMGLAVWSPLASGILTGKYDDGIPKGSRLDRLAWLKSELTDERLARVRTFAKIAEQAGTSRAKLAIAWCAQRPCVSTVIGGASSLAQLDENLAALDVQVTPEIAKQLDELFDDVSTAPSRRTTAT